VKLIASHIYVADNVAQRSDLLGSFSEGRLASGYLIQVVVIVNVTAWVGKRAIEPMHGYIGDRKTFSNFNNKLDRFPPFEAMKIYGSESVCCAAHPYSRERPLEVPLDRAIRRSDIGHFADYLGGVLDDGLHVHQDIVVICNFPFSLASAIVLRLSPRHVYRNANRTDRSKSLYPSGPVRTLRGRPFNDGSNQHTREKCDYEKPRLSEVGHA